MSRRKGEEYFREEACILYGQGKDVEYISRILNTEKDVVWKWIQESIRRDLYAEFDGVWELVQKQYFGDCQSLAKQLGKKLKLKDGRRETVYYPK